MEECIRFSLQLQGLVRPNFSEELNNKSLGKRFSELPNTEMKLSQAVLLYNHCNLVYTYDFIHYASIHLDSFWNLTFLSMRREKQLGDLKTVFFSAWLRMSCPFEKCNIQIGFDREWLANLEVPLDAQMLSIS